MYAVAYTPLFELALEIDQLYADLPQKSCEIRAPPPNIRAFSPAPYLYYATCCEKREHLGKYYDNVQLAFYKLLVSIIVSECIGTTEQIALQHITPYTRQCKLHTTNINPSSNGPFLIAGHMLLA